MADIAAGAEHIPELVRRAQNGDRNAFGRIAKEFGPRIYRAVFYLTRNPDDAADLTQETLFRAYRGLARFDSRRPFYPWIYRIARNLTYTYNERKQRSISVGDNDALIPDEVRDPDAAMIAEQQSRSLHAGLKKLSTEHREIIVLKHFEQCSYAEIAEILGIPIGTVMSRLYNARTKLRMILSEEDST